MSMRHHWQELDELLAQLDREARFKRGPFRPGLKALRLAEPTGEISAVEVELPSTDVMDIKTVKTDPV